MFVRELIEQTGDELMARSAEDVALDFVFVVGFGGQRGLATLGVGPNGLCAPTRQAIGLPLAERGAQIMDEQNSVRTVLVRTQLLDAAP